VLLLTSFPLREEDIAMVAPSLAPNRRGHFPSLEDAEEPARREIAGVPQLHFAEIARLPDDRLFQLIPVVASAVQIYFDDGVVAARFVTTETSGSFLPAGGQEHSLLHQCDGIHSLQQICDRLASHADYCNQPVEEMRQALKGQMLQLIERRICLPHSPVD
jgi:hypothetical protein